MKKSIKKLLAIVTAFSVMVVFNVTSYAYSSDTISESESANSEILYTILGQDLPCKLVEELASYSVQVSSNTVIKAVRMRTSERSTGDSSYAALGPTSLVVTNETGRNVITDVFFAINSDGQYVSVMPEDGNLSVPRSGATEYLPPEGAMLVHATAVFNKVYEPDDYLGDFPYYQPVGMYFIYYANGVDTLTYAYVSYQSNGYEYTYPGFVDVSGGVLYSHEISRLVSNPASNTIYHKVNEYRTDRALNVSGGHPSAGIFFSYGLTINGIYSDGSTRIIDNS